MEKITLEQINEAIQTTSTKIEAAQKLGIARSTLYRLLKEFEEQTILPLHAIIELQKTKSPKRELKDVNSPFLFRDIINSDEIINNDEIITTDKDLHKLSEQSALKMWTKSNIEKKKTTRSHFIISDMQVTPSNLNKAKRTLYKIAQQVKRKKPEVLIWLGDFADMESLFRASKKYDQFDSKKFKADVKAANDAMEYFQDLIKDLKLEQHITVGNHEDRINKFIANNIQISALIKFEELEYHKYMTVHKYLEVATIDGIQYSHKFVNGSGGTDIVSARLLLKKTYGHACCGHTRKIDQFTDYKPNGEQLTTLIAGASYEHEMSYLDNPQDRLYPRQVWFCQDVKIGFNVERIDLPSLPDDCPLPR